MRKVLLSTGILAICLVAVANASNPVRILSGRMTSSFPLDPKTSNWVVRVVVEHHKDNVWLDVECDGDSFLTASGRYIPGIEKEGIFEERFFFNFPAGTYVCGAVLTRGGKNLPSVKTEFFVG